VGFLLLWAAGPHASDGAVLAVLVTFAILTPFFWWTMHFLLAGRAPWRRLLPSAILTGVFFAGPRGFPKFYFQRETEALRAENRLIEEVEAERARLTAAQMFRRSIRDVSVVTDG
jgi:hypothetical protein